MRILGKGKTAQAIKELYSQATMYDDNDLESFDKESDELTVVSPGIPPFNSLVVNTKNLASEYDIFKDVMPYSIWISGTNGKTTTTSMTQHILKDKGSVCGGNIGTPLAKLDTNAKLWILETSSFTLHYTNKVKPNIYLLLPISDDHASWHGGFKDYEQSKLKPLSLMDSNDIAIVPSKYKDYKTDAKMYYYNSSEDLAEQFDIDINKISFKEPFTMDALLALAARKILFNDIPYDMINTFVQDPHKLEEFKDDKGRVWIDDSKATNIDATIQAIKSYKDKKIYLILGGDDKGADLTPLFDELKNYNIEIYSIGTNAQKLFELSNRHNLVCNICNNLDKAVDQISTKLSINNGVGMLSPAAASLDQFSSYKDRGECFKKEIYKK